MEQVAMAVRLTTRRGPGHRTPMHDSKGQYCPLCHQNFKPREHWAEISFKPLGGEVRETFAHRRCVRVH